MKREKSITICHCILLLISAGLSVFAACYFDNETLKSFFLGTTSNLLVVGLVYFFMKNFMRLCLGNKRSKVSVELRCGGKQLDWPLEIPLSQFSRSEVMGRLGMIPMKGEEQKQKRGFVLEFTGKQEFLEALNRISEKEEEEVSILLIPCSKEELEQFDAQIK